MRVLRVSRTVALTLVISFTFFTWLTLVSGTPGVVDSTEAAPILQQTDALSVTIDGPDIATLGEEVNYTVAYTASGNTWFIEYSPPSGFSVTELDPAPHFQGEQTITWLASNLDGTPISITGTHDVGSCANTSHSVMLDDNYTDEEPVVAVQQTTVNGVFCTFLPIVVQAGP